ncbi:MAG: ferrous iron transporter B, partial [Ramlibacter sp.]
MNEAVIHLHAAGRLAALVGNPNAGKTALFNRLTGSSQKVANYAGVTVERKEGRLGLATGKTVRILDLPGTYSLHPRSPDERITCEVLRGNAAGEKKPDLVVCVVDATNLRRGLRLVLGVKRMGLPCVVALNMADLAASRGIVIDSEALSRELDVPVVRTVAIEGDGDSALRELLEKPEAWERSATALPLLAQESELPDHEAVRAILQRLNLDHVAPHLASDRIDGIVLHPVVGPILLAVLLFFVFQAVFAWAVVPMDAIKAATGWFGKAVADVVPEGRVQSFLVDGLVAGLGGVVVFLPQILILFFFILVLEESGYLPRAAFLLDRLMGGVGLSGRSFIPLLSSFACAIPGIMAARTIANPRDRLVTIM